MPRPVEMPTPIAWQGVIQEHIDHLRAGGLRPASIRLRHQWLRRLARAFPDGYEIAEKDLVAWSASNDWMQETRRSAHAQVNNFYKWAKANNFVECAPELPRVKKAYAVARPATDFAHAKAMMARRDDVRLMVRLASEVGMRRGEVCQAATWDVVQDLVGYSLIVHGKGGKERIVPITDNLAKAILDCPVGYLFPGKDNGHLSPAWVSKLVGRALLPGVTMHQLRHRFASRTYRATRDVLSVQRLLGHASPEVTLRYIQLDNELLRAAVNAAA